MSNTAGLCARRTSHSLSSESEQVRDPSLTLVLTPSTPSEEIPSRPMTNPGLDTTTTTLNDPLDTAHSVAGEDIASAARATGIPAKGQTHRKSTKELYTTNRKRQSEKRRSQKQVTWSSPSDTENDSSPSTSDSESTSDASETVPGASSSDSSSSTDSETSEKKRRQQKKSKSKKLSHRRGTKPHWHGSESNSDLDDTDGGFTTQDEKVVRKLLAKLRARRAKESHCSEGSSKTHLHEQVGNDRTAATNSKQGRHQKGHGNRTDDQTLPKSHKSKSKGKMASKMAFKRVDQLWDDTIHNYKLSETADEPDNSEWDQYLFTVRRRFDWESRYVETLVDVKSKPLRDALAKVMNGIKGVSMVQETAAVDPNMLFLYLEEIRQYRKELKEAAKAEEKRKARRAAAVKAAHLRVLIKYLDVDYAETQKTLYPLLDANMITYDLLWALFKPNTIAYTAAYDVEDEPRAFKIEYSASEASFMGGQWYSVKGRYLEYDGKSFGMGAMAASVQSFKGVRKITGLECYPIRYHKESEAIRARLIERGKRFVALQGMNYRFHKGMAFYKKKKSVIKVNVNGRIMIDPALHRRINPNYPVSNMASSDIYGSDNEQVTDDEYHGVRPGFDLGSDYENPDESKIKFKVVRDAGGRAQVIQAKPNGNVGATLKDRIDESNMTDRVFTEEELLTASPVVLGFAFNEKLWLEFTVSGVSEIEWNEDAFDSLVLPSEQKSVVKALVESHTFHTAQNIDDVIQGKGKGLVSVLHGPPGTGKTLTAEGIAELLKRPLYVVSAGELGTDPRLLEAELNKILDIAHSWGAVLLLDEADIFLEKRTIQDIHRNALVSIFLRLLEYFQGILFLTTNRVETFDDAFQSRIHLAIRYGELTSKAKRSVWKMFLDRVYAKEGLQTASFSDRDLDALARHSLNGRQIKNSVRTAQALAVNENMPLSMEHIKRVLDVAENFEHDLRGGMGYLDAMRSYT